MDKLKSEYEQALRDFQEQTGLEYAGPNLWPGTAARIAMEYFWKAYNMGYIEGERDA